MEIDDYFYFYNWFSATEFVFIVVGIVANVFNTFGVYAYMMELERGNIAGEAAAAYVSIAIENK